MLPEDMAMKAGTDGGMAAGRRVRRCGLLPQCKGFPIGWGTHAAKNERRRCLEQVAATVLPFRFRSNDAHAVCAERKNCEIPVATIGRSLSGGVTGCIVPNLSARRKGAKFVFYGNRVEKQERKAA